MATQPPLELYSAAESGDAEKIRKTLASLKDPNLANAPNRDGKTPLYLACKGGHFLAALELANFPSIDLNIRGPDNDTPLHVASSNNRDQIIALLLVRGANVTRQNTQGFTPRQLAKGRALTIYTKFEQGDSGIKELCTKWPQIFSPKLSLIASGQMSSQTNALSAPPEKSVPPIPSEKPSPQITTKALYWVVDSAGKRESSFSLMVVASETEVLLKTDINPKFCSIQVALIQTLVPLALQIIIKCKDILEVFLEFETAEEHSTLYRFLDQAIQKSQSHSYPKPDFQIPSAFLYSAAETLNRWGHKPTGPWKPVPFGFATAITPKNTTQQTLGLLQQNRYQSFIPTLSWGVWKPEHPLFGALLLQAGRQKFQLSRENKKHTDVDSPDLRFAEQKLAEDLTEIFDDPTQFRASQYGFGSRPISIVDTGSINDTFTDQSHIHFLNLLSAKVDTAFKALYPLCAAAISDTTFLSKVSQTYWPSEVVKYITNTKRIIQDLESGKVVIIQHGGSSNSLPASILASLTQLAVDEFYRTPEGFTQLFCKEFLSFGSSLVIQDTTDESSSETCGDGSLEEHSLAQAFSIMTNRYHIPFIRPARVTVAKTHVPAIASFLLYVHCVVELLHEFPSYFSLNETFLLNFVDQVLISDILIHRDNQTLQTEIAVKHFLHAIHTKAIVPGKNPIPQTKSAVLPLLSWTSNVDPSWFGFVLRHNISVQQGQEKVIEKIEKCIEKNENRLIIVQKNLCFLPPIIEKATMLTKLSLSNSLFTTLPESITKLVNLKQLEMSFNRFHAIPEIIFGLSELEDLAIDNNFIRFVPEGISRLTSLKTLSLKCNPLQSAQGIGRLTWLKKLDLQQSKKQPLSKLPFFVGFPKMEEFCAQGLMLASVPSKFLFDSKMVTILDLSGNALTLLPPLDMPYLTTLLLQHNELTAIPFQLDCPSLQFLNLNDNNLTALPRALGSLTSLLQLEAHSNKIKEIPFWLGSLSKLELLDLGDNDIKQVSHCISQMSSLIKLKLSNNDISTLPLSMGNLSKTLKQLQLRENPLVWPDISALQGSVEEVLNALTEKLTQTTQLNRVRTVMLGAAHYSQLVLKMINKKWARPTGPQFETEYVHVPTFMIEVGASERKGFGFGLDPLGDLNKWGQGRASVALKKSAKPGFDKKRVVKRAISVDFWIFENEDLVSSLHKIFAPNTMFIITLSLNEDYMTKLENWLRYLKSNINPTGHVMLILTNMEGESKKEDKRPIEEERLRNEILGAFEATLSSFVSCSIQFLVHNEESIATLKDAFEEAAENDPMPMQEIPNTYLQLVHLLKEKEIGDEASSAPSLPIVERKRLFQLAATCNLRTLRESKRAVRLLHSLGEIIYWNNPRTCEDIIIKDPHWFVGLVNNLFGLKDGQRSGGLFTKQQLQECFKADQQSFEQLVSLMEKFELLVTLPSGEDAEDKYALPFLFSNELPAEGNQIWPTKTPEGEHQIERIIQAPFFPPGLKIKVLKSVIEKMNAQANCLWANGLILTWTQGATTIIHIFMQNESKHSPKIDQITVKVRGNSQSITRAVFSLFMTQLTAAISSFPNLKTTSYFTLDGTLFPLTTTEIALANGDDSVTANGKSLPLANIIPELLILGYTGVRLQYGKLEKDKGRILGEGGYATVFESKHDGVPVAVKKFKLTQAENEEDREDGQAAAAFEDFRHEVTVQGSLDHPNIVRILGVCMNPFCIVQELCSEGSLYDFIHHWSTPIQWKLRLKLTLDLAKGIEYLQSYKPHPIAHIDMKSPNILLVSKNPDAPVCAKISDFGTAQFVPANEFVYVRKVENPVWCAPEVMKPEPYNIKVDTYAFGVICYEILTRQDFFGDINWIGDLTDTIVAGARPPIPRESPVEYTRLIESCWKQEPALRPKFSSVIVDIQNMQSKHASWDQSHGNPQNQQLKTKSYYALLTTKSTELLPTEPKLAPTESKLAPSIPEESTPRQYESKPEESTFPKQQESKPDLNASRKTDQSRLTRASKRSTTTTSEPDLPDKDISTRPEGTKPTKAQKIQMSKKLKKTFTLGRAASTKDDVDLSRDTKREGIKKREKPPEVESDVAQKRKSAKGMTDYNQAPTPESKDKGNDSPKASDERPPVPPKHTKTPREESRTSAGKLPREISEPKILNILPKATELSTEKPIPPLPNSQSSQQIKQTPSGSLSLTPRAISTLSLQSEEQPASTPASTPANSQTNTPTHVRPSDSLTCAKCKATNPAGSKFCKGCGDRSLGSIEPASPSPAAVDLYVNCPKCHLANKDNNKFCSACGEILPSSTPRAKTNLFVKKNPILSHQESLPRPSKTGPRPDGAIGFCTVCDKESTTERFCDKCGEIVEWREKK